MTLLSSFFGRKSKSSRKKRRRAGRPGRGDGRVRALEQFVVEEIEVGGVAEPIAAPKRSAPSVRRPASLRIGFEGFVLWLILIAVSFSIRDPWPVDETRMLAVAWEMWLRESVIVPWLNGDYFVHPPLAYWVIHLGWHVFGVNDWWPRLAPSLFALASVYVTGRLARRLWPEALDVQRYAPVVLLGTVVFALYVTLALPDMLQVFFALLALWGTLIMWRPRDSYAWLLVGLAVGLGSLAAGPMVLIYALPPALLAPLWVDRGSKPNWGNWYAEVFNALLLGLALGAAWAVPVGAQAGVGYLWELLVHAPALFALEHFASSHPWWWYSLLTPVVFLPWSILPLNWARLWHIRAEPSNAGLNFCIVWIVSVLMLLSLFDMKQPQFLLPVLPAGALMTAHLLLNEELHNYGHDSALSGMTIPLILFGGLAAIIPKLPRVDFLPQILWEISPFVGVAIVIVGIALAWLPLKEVRRRTTDTALIGVLLALLIVIGAGSQFNASYRVNEAALAIRQAQDASRPVAYVGDYQGQFQFSGRLYQSLAILDARNAERWARQNPSGIIVALADAWRPLAVGAKPVFDGRVGDQALRIWDAALAVR